MWKRTFSFIAGTISLLSAEQAIYSDANRSLYDSPRNRAMGGSLLAISSEPMPSGLAAGITTPERGSVYLGYAGFFGNSFGASTAGFTIPVDSKQSVGGSVSYLMVPGVDSISMQYNGSGVPGSPINNEKTASELFVNLVYGRDLLTFARGTLSAGAAVHLKRIRLIDLTGYGVGADLSVQSKFKSGGSVALKLDNAFTEYSYWSQNYHENGLPRLYFGSAFDRDFTSHFGFAATYRSPDLLGNSGVGGGAFGKENQFDGEPESQAISDNVANLFTAAGYGTEFRFNKIVAIRAGWSDTRILSFGGGVHLFDRWDIDFVYGHSGALEGTYSISTKVEL